MRKAVVLFISFFIVNSTNAQESYKTMINDLDINFYDICKVADAHFDTINKDEKGSGYKGYMRWKNNNEYKFYPSGDRINIDPFFAQTAFQTNSIGTQSISFNNGWNELGPFRIDSISNQYSAGLGRVEDHYVDPNDTNVMYLGSRSGGFWKTSDGGLNWQGGFSDTLMASGVNAIAVSPTNHDSILINVRNSRNGNSHGIYRSIDGGNNWTLSNFKPAILGFGGLGSSFKIFVIAYHPTIPNLIFVGTSKGIYKSTDNLQSWTILYPTGDITDIKFHPTNPNVMYIMDTYSPNGNRNYVLRSTNLGVSYSQSNLVVGNNNNGSVHLSVSPDCPNCVYYASNNGIWKSVDSGMNFTFLINPSQACGGFSVNDADTSNMIYGYVDIEQTTDGGNTFNQVTWWSLGSTQHGTGNFQTKFANSTAYVHADLHPAKCVNGSFYVGTDGTFSKSSDGGSTWEVLNQGTPIRENYKLGVSQSNHYRSISGSQDNGTSIKLKDTWLEFYGADGMEAIIHPLNDDWMIGSVQYGNRKRTTDGGQTLSGVSPPNNGNAAWEAPIAYDPNNQMRIYDFRDSVYVSEDFGSNWVYKGKATSFTGTIKQAAIAENNSDIIIIAKDRYIDKSINGGATFASIKSNLPNNTIQDIAFDPKDDNTIIVTYATYQNNNSKVYITTNGGTSWANITYNLGNMPIHSVVIDHSNSSNFYVGAEIGVYTKTMSATTWSLYNPNLPNTTVEELEIVYGSNTLKAATWGRGLWEYNLVNRASYPSVVTTRITDQPTDDYPKFGMDQFVTSVISHSSALDTVFLKWSVNSATFDSTIAMTNTVDSTWVSQSALPNYVAGTKMYFKVFAVGNGSDTTETYKFMYTVKPFDYCTATGNNNAGNLYISNLSVANIDNSSTNDAYTYYNDSVVYLFVDSTYSISLSANTTWASNDCNAWIDFNHNTLFEPSESLALPSFTGNTSQNNFTVPSNANHTDTLRLRTRLSYWGSVPPICGSTLGEVEDYPVIVTAIPTLAFTLSSSILCQGEQLYVNYTGDAVDSVVWTFTSGSNSFSTSGVNDSLAFSNSGTYDLNLVAYTHGFSFVLDSANIVLINVSSAVNINLTSCNIADTGTVVQNFTNAIGCDSIITTITTLLLGDSVLINQGSCNAADTGIVIQSLNNVLGCDSIVTTITTLLPSDNIQINQGSCNPQNVGTVIQNLTNAYGCDSTVITYTSLLPTDSVTVTDVSCVANDIGTTVLVLSNGSGCDSVITTITTLDQIQGSISQVSNVLTAQPAGITYQWLDCDSNFAFIVGETQQAFTATSNGNYAVLLRDDACSDTVNCIQVTGLSIGDMDAGRELNMYPNPTSQTIIIELDQVIDISEFSIFNMIGENVTSHILIKNLGGLKMQMDFNNVASGVYLIRTKSTVNKVTKY